MGGVSCRITERARVLLLEGRADYTIAHNNGVTPRAMAVGAQLLEVRIWSQILVHMAHDWGRLSSTMLLLLPC